MTLNESLKGIATDICSVDYQEKKKQEIAISVAKIFADFRTQLLNRHFVGATESELQKELDAFKNDTKNGLYKVVIASKTKTTENGELLDEDGNKIEKAQSFATVESTNKDGETISTRLVFRYPYVADTIQRNISIVASWLTFRETVSDSFAAMRQLEREKVAKEIAKLEKEMFVAYMSDNEEKASQLKAMIKQMKEENGL